MFHFLIGFCKQETLSFELEPTAAIDIASVDALDEKV